LLRYVHRLLPYRSGGAEVYTRTAFNAFDFVDGGQAVTFLLDGPFRAESHRRARMVLGTAVFVYKHGNVPFNEIYIKEYNKILK
jgi:hypothetical protein